MYLQVGDGHGLIDYVGPQGSALATKVVPADDLPLWSPMYFLVEENMWEPPTGKIANGVYGQSCSSCHNVGPTRPANASYALGNGATQTTSTPTTVSELGVQCEACHGSGKNPNGHKNGVPGVVGGYQVLRSQVCGQCHVAGVTPQKGVSGSAFGNPNAYTTDETLTAYLTPSTVVETEGALMNFLNGQTATKPKFLPRRQLLDATQLLQRWLVNKVPVECWQREGPRRPGERLREGAVAAGNTRCLKCHSGFGFLNPIDAKGPSGKRIVPTFPTMSVVATADRESRARSATPDTWEWSRAAVTTACAARATATRSGAATATTGSSRCWIRPFSTRRSPALSTRARRATPRAATRSARW